MAFLGLLLGWLLAASATAIVVPQLFRVLRTGLVEGVSLRACVLAILAMIAWSGFTLGRRDWPALASSLGPLCVWLACAALVARRRGALVPVVFAIAGGTLAVVLAGTYATGFELLAVAGSLLWVVPQAWTAFRDHDLSGVSVTTYLLLAAENFGWLLYAAYTSTIAYGVAPLVQLPLALIIATRARSRRGSLPAVEEDAVEVVELVLEDFCLETR